MRTGLDRGRCQAVDTNPQKETGPRRGRVSSRGRITGLGGKSPGLHQPVLFLQLTDRSGIGWPDIGFIEIGPPMVTGPIVHALGPCKVALAGIDQADR